MKLAATDEHDLTVLAAMTQDALVPVDEMIFQPEEKRFYLALNRFCWEEKAKPHHRIHSALCIENVERVQLRNIDLTRQGEMLDLLTIIYDDKSVFLKFAGHRDVRMQVADLACRLDDFGTMWTTKNRPRHG